jgi:hypothetical protein
MKESDSLIARARHILKTEGLISLAGKALNYLRRRLFLYQNVYLYEHTLKERNGADYMPGLQGFTHRVIASNRQADEVASEGFDDIRNRPVLLDARRCLDKGAIAFCIFVGTELAHISWAATSEQAKKTFDALPYRVAFSQGQVCTGGTVTLPEYRGSGFMGYGYYKKLDYLRQRGYATSRNAVAKGNVASQKVHARFGPRIYAQARYLRILRWTLWRESPYRPEAIKK